MFYDNMYTIKDKQYPVRYLTKSESGFVGCVNEGYVIDGIITIGYCECPIWETIVVWHEIGHVYLDTNDEQVVWEWTLQNLPIVVPMNYLNIIRNRMNR